MDTDMEIMKQNIWVFDLQHRWPRKVLTFNEYYAAYNRLIAYADDHNIETFYLADQQFIVNEADAVLFRLGGFQFDTRITTIAKFVDYLCQINENGGNNK